MQKILTTKNIARIAVLGALGAALMMFEIPLTFVAPSFYKLDLGDLPCLIGAFAMGPIPAFLIQVIKILIKMIIKPTSTAFVGELAAFIFSTTYCVIASIIYTKNKTKKGAIIGLVVASIAQIVVATIANYAFIIPAYVSLFHLPLEVIVSMGNAIFPFVTDKLTFCIACVAPFNLVKTIIVSILTIVLYKHVSPLLKDRN